jgi:hypothetical protein
MPISVIRDRERNSEDFEVRHTLSWITKLDKWELYGSWEISYLPSLQKIYPKF